jgi:hypothetical protein
VRPEEDKASHDDGETAHGEEAVVAAGQPIPPCRIAA